MYEGNAGVYKHSGGLGTSLLVVPMIALFGTLLAAIAYAYVTVYSPIAGYVSIIFVGCYAFALTVVVAQTGYWAKCRNPGFLHLAGFVTGLLGLYCAWAAFVYVLLAREEGALPAGVTMLDVFASPDGVWQLVLAINENGWYSIRGGTPTGIALWIMWGIEAVIVVGMPTLAATIQIDDVVFCEDCRRWCKATEKAARLSLPENIDELDALHEGDISPLARLQTVAGEDEPHLAVDTQECSNCNATGAFQTKLVQYQLDKDEKLEEQTTDITGLVLASKATVDEIAALGHRPVVEPVATADDADAGDEESDESSDEEETDELT